MNISKLDLNLHFEHDTGVNYGMLKDHTRNQFYEDAIINSNVTDKNCIDVGFGTGFLSFLLEKHGAKSILGYEVDPDLAKLGQNLVKEFYLSDKIKVINDCFNCYTNIGDYVDLLIHEIFGNELYSEGVINLFEINNKNIEILPNIIGTEFRMVPLTGKQFYSIPSVKKFYEYKKTVNYNISYDSGIKKFGLYNNKISTLYRQHLLKKYQNYLINCDPNLDTFMHKMSEYKSTLIGETQVNFNNRKKIVNGTEVDKNNMYLTLDIPKDKITVPYYAIIPMHYILHKGCVKKYLYNHFDSSKSFLHWGIPKYGNFAVKNQQKSLLIKQSLLSGNIFLNCF